MSLAIVLVGKESIVVASDNRVSIQAGGISFTKDNMHKVIKLNDNVVLSSLGNYVGFSNWLQDMFIRLYKDDLDKDTISKVSLKFSQFIKHQYDIYSKDVNSNWLTLSENIIEYVLVGYTDENTPHIIRLNNIGRQLPFSPELLDEKYYISGETSVAYYLLRKLELVKAVDELTEDELKNLSVYIIKETAKANNNVSSSIDMMVINNESGVNEISSSDIDKISIEATKELINDN